MARLWLFESHSIFQRGLSMNIKSLLIGSAAALIAVSGARAADAVVAEPEAVEYVRVCDAYGAGFFYIPGTETCLKIGGYVRYQIDFSSDDDEQTRRGDGGWRKKAVADLHALGIKVVMLTGDDEKTANHIASLVGIDEVVAHVLPEGKLEKSKELQSAGGIVAMAGDGVNDAPALAQADVGIAMGTGTDVAIESAGITLLGGDISKLVKAIKLSKITMRGIKQNLFWAFIYNVVWIPLAAGVFYPIFD